MRRLLRSLLLATLTLLPGVLVAEEALVAGKPLYRDPVYDGAADPVVIWNAERKAWWMFYTNRRANAEGLPGVSWVHGTPIGIAESTNGGATWAYFGDAQFSGIDSVLGAGDGSIDKPTYWAPEVIEAEGAYHMFLTVVPGVFKDWGHPRSIVHLTSDDLLHWRAESELKLVSDKVIDACVAPLPDGGYRLWYNNERDRKSIYYADSDDLLTWSDRGQAVGDQSGEAPKVFRWGDRYWMVTDVWDGLGVYRSDDMESWERQKENLLREPGSGADDRVKGGHPDVVVSGDRAYLFYFTHPGRRGPDAGADQTEQRRSSIQVAELRLENGWLACDRDAPTRIDLRVE
ncbi:Glycosyl hydrolases family 43 [Pseudobythopirellula maris]|uniref:Glycosyl hydrolases family 43 n=1 Tax=Pseudobythopirellula maris TaxID=2527991 RepID=A0A5C5ZNY4_9BACT|nr:family 43 glycosylhydrolase [Pseudobythopirellula maris]TWT88481.1 Glycosyl hydrolases family 43 [Pseudobythopirellula maris]